MEIIDRGLIYDAAQAVTARKCAAFTGLIRTADGALLCSFKVGPQKLSPEDNVCIMRSVDEGRTWSPLFEGFASGDWQGTPGSFSSAYLFESGPGALWMNCLWIDRTDPALPLANPETTGLLTMRHLVAESHDGGKTWGPLREVSLRPSPGASPTNEILRLDDGSLLLPYESWKEWDDREGTQRAHVRISRDGGGSWGPPVVMASDPDQKFYYWDNRVTLHPDSGRVLALFWTHDSEAGEDVDIHLAWSSPDGATWSQPEPTGVAGQIAAPLCLGGPDLLSAYVHRHNPPSMRAVRSSDLGKTWDLANEVVLYESGAGAEAGTEGPRYEADYWDDMYRWNFGHPRLVRIDDATVLAAYYGGTPEELSIHWTRLAL